MATSARIALCLKVLGVLLARRRRAEKPDRAVMHRGQGDPQPRSDPGQPCSIPGHKHVSQKSSKELKPPVSMMTTPPGILTLGLAFKAASN